MGSRRSLSACTLKCPRRWLLSPLGQRDKTTAAKRRKSSTSYVSDSRVLARRFFPDEQRGRRMKKAEKTNGNWIITHRVSAAWCRVLTEFLAATEIKRFVFGENRASCAAAGLIMQPALHIPTKEYICMHKVMLIGSVVGGRLAPPCPTSKCPPKPPPPLHQPPT